jgi:hypothetical protein
MGFKRGYVGLNRVYIDKFQQRSDHKMYNWQHNHKAKWATGALPPGRFSSHCWSSKEVSRTGQTQHVQDLLLDCIQFGKVASSQRAIWITDADNAVMGENLQNPGYGWFEMVTPFGHQAVDGFLALGQCPAYLSFNQTSHQRTNHNQENQTGNPAGGFQEERSDQKKLVRQPKAMFNFVLTFPLLQQAGVIQVGGRSPSHQQVSVQRGKSRFLFNYS